MKEMSVTPVRPQTMRKVVRIEAAATSSGVIARNDPNTSASTTSAPTPPKIVSTRTSAPPPPPSEVASASLPVTVTVSPLVGPTAAATCSSAGRAAAALPERDPVGDLPRRPSARVEPRRVGVGLAVDLERVVGRVALPRAVRWCAASRSTARRASGGK